MWRFGMRFLLHVVWTSSDRKWSDVLWKIGTKNKRFIWKAGFHVTKNLQRSWTYIVSIIISSKTKSGNMTIAIVYLRVVHGVPLKTLQVASFSPWLFYASVSFQVVCRSVFEYAVACYRVLAVHGSLHFVWGIAGFLQMTQSLVSWRSHLLQTSPWSAKTS